MSQCGNNIKALAFLTSISLGISIFVISAVMLITPEFRTLYAETGTGKDVFKVIVSVFDISNETGDIVTTVNVNGNSKVKSFDSDYLNIWPVSDNSSTRLIEYIATFPGMEVKPGDKYKACVLVVETANTICKDGANSPGKRPEVVDIALDSDSSTAAVKVATENTGTEKVEAKKLDTEKVEAKKLDTEKVDAKKLDTQKLNTDGLGSEPLITDEENIFGR